jgi:hypothetical protein
MLAAISSARRTSMMSNRVGLITVIGLLACAPLARAQSQSWDKVLPAAKRFVVLEAFGGDAVLDKETGLVWERTPGDLNQDGALGVGDGRSWFAAHGVCRERTVGNRRGWRLPTFEELASVTEPGDSVLNTLPAGHPFIGDFSFGPEFWSANTNTEAPTVAFVLPIGPGDFFIGLPKNANSFVWCVRGGQGLDPQ